MGRIAWAMALGLAAVSPACTSQSAHRGTTATTVHPTAAATPARRTAPHAVDPCSLLTAADIEMATGWVLPKGTKPIKVRQQAGDVCTWEDLAAGGAVQVQFHEGGAMRFDKQYRSTLDRRGRPSRRFTIKGASDAFEVPSVGLLGMVVHDDYVQLSVIGGTAHADDHVQLAARISAALR